MLFPHMRAMKKIFDYMDLNQWLIHFATFVLYSKSCVKFLSFKCFNFLMFCISDSIHQHGL